MDKNSNKMEIRFKWALKKRGFTVYAWVIQDFHQIYCEFQCTKDKKHSFDPETTLRLISLIDSIYVNSRSYLQICHLKAGTIRSTIGQHLKYHQLSKYEDHAVSFCKSFIVKGQRLINKETVYDIGLEIL